MKTASMKILLAVDGSRHARWATELLTRLPLAAPPVVRPLTVVEHGVLTHPAIAPPLVTQPNRAMKKQMAAAKGLATRTARRVRRRWKRVRPIVEGGSPVETILERAASERTDLIVLGSRGLSNIQAFLLGSVSQQVVTYAPCSVLIVKRHSARVKRLLVTVDGSRAADKVITFLISNLHPQGIDITVAYVYHPKYIFTVPGAAISDYLDDWLNNTYVPPLEAAGFAVETACVKGHSAAKIIDVARRRHVDLIVMGSRGLTGLKRFLLGSVSQQVVKHSPVSVLVVRPG
jgi:nucleotide-binding universal stress UspA family protein